MSTGVVVIGHIGRDVVLAVEVAPGAGSSVAARERREMLGGKAANQALSLVELGHHAAVVGVLGDDGVGRWALDVAAADRIDVSHVVVRPSTSTSLVVSVVDAEGRWRYVEDLPDATYVTTEDVDHASHLIGSAAVVSLQMQEPAESLLRAVEHARSGSALVVADGAPAADADTLLTAVDVWRADAREAGLLLGGSPIASPDEAFDAARAIASRGPRVVMVGGGDSGDVIVWPEGQARLPRINTHAVDPTGGGDAAMAGLIDGLVHHPGDPLLAGCQAMCAAGSVVQRLGGRPEIDAEAIRAEAVRWRSQLSG